MSAPSALRRWLRRSPQPTKIRLDGDKMVAVATGANQWAVTEETVLAMSPTKLEALDSTGLVLRALKLDRAEDDDDGATSEKRKPGPEDRFNQFARLLNEAHDAGARRHADAYATAFNEMVRLVGVFADRLSGLEKAWSIAIQQSAKAQADAVLARAGDGEGDPMNGTIAALLQATVASNAAAAINGAANGKPKPKGG